MGHNRHTRQMHALAGLTDSFTQLVVVCDVVRNRLESTDRVKIRCRRSANVDPKPNSFTPTNGATSALGANSVAIPSASHFDGKESAPARYRQVTKPIR